MLISINRAVKRKLDYLLGRIGGKKTQ